MKITLVLGIMGIGGHTRSAVAVGRALREQGHEVRVFGADRGGRHVVEQGGLPLECVSPTRGLAPALAAAFGRFATSFVPDVVHCFDDRALILVHDYVSSNRIPLVLTICGGPVPRYAIPDMCPIVVFSEELREGLHACHGIPKEHVFVNAARIELAAHTYDPAPLRAYRERNQLGDLPVVLLITRIDNTKMNAVLHVIRTMDLLGGERPARLLVVGKVGSEVAYRQIRAAADDLNSRRREPVVTVTEDGAEQASRLIPLASVAVGIGRTAFEAMSQGVPTLIVGEHGLAGPATKELCPRMARRNFSGRDALDLPAEARSVAATAAELLRILTDSRYARRVGEEGRTWVAENLDSTQGARFYGDLYRRPASFFHSPTLSGMTRFRIQFLIRASYHSLVPPVVKDLVVLVRKKYGGL